MITDCTRKNPCESSLQDTFWIPHPGEFVHRHVSCLIPRTAAPLTRLQTALQLLEWDTAPIRTSGLQ